MIKSLPFLFLLFYLTVHPAWAYDIGGNDLQITIGPVAQGLELAGIRRGGLALLAAPSSLFSLTLSRVSDQQSFIIRSTGGWATIHTGNDNNRFTAVFSDPVDDNLPDSLRVTMTLDVSGVRSQWNLSVTGVGAAHSLLDVTFPELHIRAPGNDYFLLPKYSGVLVPDPVAGGIDSNLLYPRGWSATMQFLAYYNANYGIYIGFHDPKASIKYFSLKATNGYLNFKGTIPAENKTVANNDFHMDGPFELDLFTGNWFDAARIYKRWARQYAEYWPKMTPERKLRQAELGRIGIWGYYSAGTNTSMAAIKRAMSDFIDFFQKDLNVPVGIHWYRWNSKDFDDDYPDYFPERDGMDALISELQQSGNAAIMPYVNGRLYDTDLTGDWDYAARGRPYAAKDANGDVYTQHFNGNTFAVMCPTRTDWQDILVDAAFQLTGRIGAGGIYLDQVAAAAPVQCMDANHDHPLGGGHWWRDGYRDMFAKIRTTIAPGKFVIVEGGADYMADKVDGFLTDGWQANNLVPAFQAVYGGRVQLVGKATGTSRYRNQSFYCKLGQAFVQGVQPGRQSLWIVHDADADLARPFVKRLATLRYRLENFLAFGAMLKPLPLSGNIPLITSSWKDYGSPVDVTIPAIQTGLYRDEHTGDLAAVFVNTSMTDPLDFTFTLHGREFGCAGKLTLQEITATRDNPPHLVDTTFIQNTHLEPMDAAAFIIRGCHPFPWPMFLQAITGKTS